VAACSGRTTIEAIPWIIPDLPLRAACRIDATPMMPQPDDDTAFPPHRPPAFPVGL